MHGNFKFKKMVITFDLQQEDNQKVTDTEKKYVLIF